MMLSLFFHSLLLFSSPLPSSAFTPPRPVESDNTLRIKNEKTRSLLLFTNVTEKHFGNYTCFASNRLGASNASMLLFRKLIQKYMQVHAHNAQFTLVRKRGLSQSTLTFIPHGYQSTCGSLNRCDTPTQNDPYALTHHFPPRPPPPISFLHCTQHSIFFLSPLLPPSPHFRYSPPH